MREETHHRSEDESTDRQSRRRSLRTAGATALLGASGVSGSASASSGASTSAEAAGISEKISENLANGDVERARQLAEKYDVEYSFGKKQFTRGQSEDGVQTEDLISRGGSTVYLFVYKSRKVDGDQIYVASTSINVDPSSNWITDNGAPKDLFVLNWSDTYWQPVSQSVKNYSKTGPDRNLLDYKLYNTYSVQAEVDDMEFRGAGTDFTLGFETELEKLDTDNKYNVTAEYLHTWNTSGSYYVDSFTFGPANFNLDGVGVSRWDAPIAVTEQE